MNINKTRTNIFFFIYNILIVVFTIGFFALFSESRERSYITSYIDKYSETISENISDKVVYYKEDMRKLIEDEGYTVREIKRSIDEGDIAFRHYLDFIELTGNVFVYEDEVIDLSYDFGFFSTKFIFIKYDKYVAIFNDYDFLSDAMNVSNALNLFIMDRTGKIYYHHDKNHNERLLKDLIKVNVTDYFATYFNKGKNTYIRSKQDGSTFIFDFILLEQFDMFYLGATFDEKVILEFNIINVIALGVILIALSFLNFLVLGLLYRSLILRNAQIETTRRQYYYINSFIFIIDKKGKIIRNNFKVKEAIGNTRGKDVFDLLEINNITYLAKIVKGERFVANINSIPLYFTPLRYRKGFFLIGEDSTNHVSSNDETYNLAYYDKDTKMPNFYLLERNVNTYFKNNTRNNVTLVSFEVITSSSIESNFSKRLRYLTYLEVSKMLNDYNTKNKIGSLIYNPREDVFVIEFRDIKEKETIKHVEKILEMFLKPVTILDNLITINIRGAILELNQIEIYSDFRKHVYNHLIETLNVAKALTTKRYTKFDETVTYALNRREELEKDLAVAIEKKEFVVYLQPQYHYDLDKIVSFEALIRWDNPKYINRSPIEFITLAEDNGMIIEIGNQSIERSFEAASKLKDYDINVAVNISPIQILEQGFVTRTLNLFKKYDLKPGSISLEITETAILDSYLVINEKINILKRNGIDIHLDDFGTGYSSLPYIKDLKFDVIKIDRAFVEHIETDKYSRAIINMITSLARTLEVDVIAEGVENVRQLEMVVRSGVKIIQGFFISRAVSVNDAITMLNDYNVDKTKQFVKTRRK